MHNCIHFTTNQHTQNAQNHPKSSGDDTKYDHGSKDRVVCKTLWNQRHKTPPYRQNQNKPPQQRSFDKKIHIISNTQYQSSTQHEIKQNSKPTNSPVRQNKNTKPKTK